ncbi:hypothetical protein K8I28_02515 [bacterium]|nr:hypothetical protein [bacterium]
MNNIKNNFNLVIAVIVLCCGFVYVPSAFTQENWRLDILLEQGEITDDQSRLGVHPNAEDEYDILDTPNPPYPPGGDFIRGLFDHPEWEAPGFTQFIEDIRSTFTPNETKTWEIWVVSSGLGEVSFNLDIVFEERPPELSGTMTIGEQTAELFSGEELLFPYTGQDIVQVELTMSPVVVVIPIEANRYNMINFSINPLDLNAETHFSQIADLQIVYDEYGGIFLPELNIDTIGEITPTRGYRVLAQSESELDVEGYSIPHNQEYTWNSGRWNYLAHPYLQPAPIVTIFSDLEDQISIILAHDGSMWIPELGLDTIGNLDPGAGYFIFPLQTIHFMYPR